MGRIILAFKWFFRILFGSGYTQIQQLEHAHTPFTNLTPEIPVKTTPKVTEPPVQVSKPSVSPPAPTVVERREGSESSALKLLAILQQEGRLIDFLQEDIAGYTDEQVGGAARAIHSGCRKVIMECATVEAVLAGDEGSPCQVPSGFDPHRIRLVGNVSGNPPFSGVLRHHGWRVSKLKLPTTPPGQDLAIIAAAEVEV